MRKRMIWINSLIVFFSMLILLVSTCLIVSSVNTRNSENELKDYLSVAKKIFADEIKDETVSEATSSTSQILHTSNYDLRVTIIDISGNVLIDTSQDDITENHLSRPEIQNLGVVYYRYSNTLKINMMYVAGIDDSSAYYIRMAMPQASVNGIVNEVLGYGFIALLGVLAISVATASWITKKMLKPLKEQTDKLALIVDKNPGDFVGSDIDKISSEIDEANNMIAQRVGELTIEKDKLSFLIDSISQGLAVISSNLQVIVINKSAARILGTKPEECLGQTYLNIVRVPETIALIEKGTKEKVHQNLEYTSLEEHKYLLSVYSIEGSWCATSGKFGVALFFIDVTDQKALEETKKDFFANASHELKSPLTSIIGYVQLIKEGIITDKKDVDEALGRVISESNRMNEILIQMLELSSLESGRPIAKESISIRNSAKEIVLLLNKEAEIKKVTVSISGDDFSVYAQKEDIDSLLRNLIENAIRYNKDGGTVSISISSLDWTVAVADTGIGIALSDQSRIYERFYRVDQAKSKKLGGTGLGLSIVKHICMNYGFKISLVSELGKGSKFTVIFSSKEPNIK